MVKPCIILLFSEYMLSLEMTRWLLFSTGSCQSKRPVSFRYSMLSVLEGLWLDLKAAFTSVTIENFNTWSEGAPFFISSSFQPCGIRDLNGLLEQGCLHACILNEVRHTSLFGSLFRVGPCSPCWQSSEFLQREGAVSEYCCSACDSGPLAVMGQWKWIIINVSKYSFNHVKTISLWN